MLSTSSLGVWLLASASTLAVVDARRSFADTVKLAEADRTAIAQKISHHNAALAKRLARGYSPPAPRRRSLDAAAAKTKRASGEADIPLTLTVSSGLDSSYFGNITVGEGDAATDFSVIPDTGSADLWVPAASSGYTPSYDCSSSSSCEDLNESWSIQYGSGATSGDLVKDTVTLAGLEVDDQTMALADSGLSSLLTSDFNGIMGLAFSSIAESQENTVVENLLSEGVITDHLFGVYLARSSQAVKDASEEQYYSAVSAYTAGGLAKRQATATAAATTASSDGSLGGGEDPFGDDDPFASASPSSDSGSSSGGFQQPTTQVDGGVIHLGHADSDFYQGDINYLDLTYAGYWEVQIDGFTNGGDTISNTQHHTILDTGTTLIYMPTDVADAFFESVGAEAIPDSSYQGYYYMSCDDLDSMDVGVSYNGQTYKIDPSDLDLGEIATGQCVLGVIAADTQDLQGNDLGILGAAFLKNVYSVFDIEGQRAGVAQLSSDKADASSDAGSANTNANASSGTNADEDDDDSSARSLAVSALALLLSAAAHTFA